MTLGVRRPLEVAERAPTSHVTEQALWHAYRGTKPAKPETRDCACGGSLSAVPGSDDVHEAIVAHNLSTAHAQWRARGARYG